MGHALLDTIRPDLWDTAFPETNAFHEAFGDCIALLTAFSDQATRAQLLQVAPDLGTANFVEAVAEDLSDGVRRDPDPRLGPKHSASAPRRSLNTFRWALPTTLPKDGPPPVLISEVHSFGRIFSGCFYDVVRNIFAAAAVKDEAALLNAAQVSGRILVTAARQAPETARFFQSMGRTMVMADGVQNNGSYRTAISDAFSGHNVALGTNAMLAPRAALAGPPPKFSTRAGAILAADTISDIKRRLDVSGKTKLFVDVLEIGAQKVARARHVREVPLHKLAKELKGVVALVPDQILVGNVQKAAAMLSAVPEFFTTEDEVQSFVATLLEHGRLALHGTTAAVRGAVAGRPSQYAPLPTHRIVSRGGRKVIERLRFACSGDRIGCCCPCH